MVLDIIIVAIIIVSAVVGYRCGLASMISHLGSWLVAVVLAFIFCSPLRTLLCENTKIDDDFYHKFVVKLGGENSGQSMNTVPDLFQDQISSARSHFVTSTATQLTDIVMAIFAFLIILVGVKLIAFAFKHLFSKQHNEGVVGFADGVIGMVMGFVIGIIVVIALMALVVPFAMSSSESFAEFFKSASENAILLPYFYDYNLILLFIKGFLM